MARLYYDLFLHTITITTHPVLTSPNPMHHTHVFHTNLPSDNLTRLLRRMPKAEIHVHLEGATSPEAIFRMAKRNHIELPVRSIEEWRQFYEFRDFDHFIDVYMLTVGCMNTPQDFFDMMVDFMSCQAQHNILYSEVFLSAALHIHRLPPGEILSALAEGAQKGSDLYGVQVKIIPDISRHTCMERDLQGPVLDFAIAAKDAGIGIGLGIGGKEIGYPSAAFKDTFDAARRAGLHVVAHAGETGDAAFMRDVLEVLRPERIGHGVHALEDPALVEDLRQRRIPLEVSPHSNYCTRVCPPDLPHPMRAMLDAGLFCTVNSDDPSMFSTDLTNEYVTLAAQGFSLDELWQLNLNGLEASFMPAADKTAMRWAWQNTYDALRAEYEGKHG